VCSIAGTIVAHRQCTATIEAMMTVLPTAFPTATHVKKARTWLTEQPCSATSFHDFKKQGVPADLLPGWIRAVGWETLVNRKGTTWRKLDDATQAAVVDATSAAQLMLADASVIKRPVVVWADGTVTVGFSDAAFQSRVA